MVDFLYHAGGGLTKDHTDIYVHRNADYQINIHLRKMNYSLIIAPRQQGKTSLINNLTSQNIHPNMIFVYIDLSTVNRANEQTWYRSFCSRILRQVKTLLPDAKQIPIPTNGSDWREFLADFAVLLTEEDYRSAIILDEIGAVTFPGTRGFFGALRDVYSSRQFEPYFNQLTFVLVGSFDPRDLIEDDAVSPFNIAQDIPLPDFTYAQVQQLVKKGSWSRDLAESISHRIYYWTNGQPYLTQKLCSILESNSSLNVDQSVKKLRREDGNHLKPLLNKFHNQAHSQQYLNRIFAGEKLKYYPNEFPQQAQLHLMGLIKSDQDGCCIVRNHIYKQILIQAKSFGEKTMLETISIPILLKAIDFLFKEGAEIIKARRERQKANQSEANEKSKEGIEISSDKSTIEHANTIRSREDAISTNIHEDAWKNSKSNVEHLLNLIEIQTKNYYLTKEQYAKWGSALVPPIIIHNLEEAETQIAETMQELQKTLSKVYGRKVNAM